ncbi:autotransporter outer membrane beta-barrel domain-containing protein, partial [Neisseriaceae bacterium TC5R-5]|nr:autotransporter outer membrane beta-barrel domain-containing protein [Neisseriaceae bacterium TC5R-5]
LEPYLNLTHVNLRTGSYHESGQEAALVADSQNTNTSFSTVGLRAAWELQAKNTPIKLNSQLGWRHAFGDTTPQTKQHFVGSSDFTITGTPLAKDSAIVSLGAELQLSRRSTLGVSYMGILSNKARENGLTAQVNWVF